jgi:hypothetical protein
MTESANKDRSAYRLRWIGYALLIYALIDVIHGFVPPDIGNPGWRLQTIGNLVERVVVPLLGFGLAFYGEFYDRLSIEKIPLRLLSWLTLLLSVIFFLLVPITLLNTFGLDTQAEQQVNAQLQQQLGRLKQVEDQINQSRPEDIAKLATRLKDAGVTVDAENPEKLKTEALGRIKQTREQLPVQAQTARSNQRQSLLKNSAKWALGALIASVLYFIIWKLSDWAR